MRPTIEELVRALVACWCPETTNEWDPENPAWGQCAVTALVVQDYLGGEILRVQASGPGFNWGHYFNRLPSGLMVDFTHRQFPLGTNFDQLEIRERAVILDPENPKNTSTIRRYPTLKRAVEQKINGSC